MDQVTSSYYSGLNHSSIQFFMIILVDIPVIIINEHAYIIEIYKIGFLKKDFYCIIQKFNNKQMYFINFYNEFKIFNEIYYILNKQLS